MKDEQWSDYEDAQTPANYWEIVERLKKIEEENQKAGAALMKAKVEGDKWADEVQGQTTTGGKVPGLASGVFNPSDTPKDPVSPSNRDRYWDDPNFRYTPPTLWDQIRSWFSRTETPATQVYIYPTKPPTKTPAQTNTLTPAPTLTPTNTAVPTNTPTKILQPSATPNFDPSIWRDRYPFASGFKISGFDHATPLPSLPTSTPVPAGTSTSTPQPTKLHPGGDYKTADGKVYANVDGQAYFYQRYKANIDPKKPESYNTYTAPYDPNNVKSKDVLIEFGNFVVLENKVGDQTYYQVFAHCDSFSKDRFSENGAKLVQGQQVKTGDQLCNEGATGNATGTHVHWEIRTSAAVTIDISGAVRHKFGNTYYPNSLDNMSKYFVDPDIFTNMLKGTPMPTATPSAQPKFTATSTPKR